LKDQDENFGRKTRWDDQRFGYIVFRGWSRKGDGIYIVRKWQGLGFLVGDQNSK